MLESSGKQELGEDRNVDEGRGREDVQERKGGIMKGRGIVQSVDKNRAMILYHFVCLNPVFVNHFRY